MNKSFRCPPNPEEAYSFFISDEATTEEAMTWPVMSQSSSHYPNDGLQNRQQVFYKLNSPGSSAPPSFYQHRSRPKHLEHSPAV